MDHRSDAHPSCCVQAGNSRISSTSAHALLILWYYLQKSNGAGQQGARPDWVHIFLAALPLLPLHAASAEAAVAAALAQAAVAIMRRHGALFRHAAVAEWEVRLRVLDQHDPWRIIVSTPTGKLAVLSPFMQNRVQCFCGQKLIAKRILPSKQC